MYPEKHSMQSKKKSMNRQQTSQKEDHLNYNYIKGKEKTTIAKSDKDCRCAFKANALLGQTQDNTLSTNHFKLK